MELKDAQLIFKGRLDAPAKALYEAAYVYAQSKNFDPMLTGDWNQAQMLLSAIADGDTRYVGEALALWVQDSNMMDVRGVQEKIAELLKQPKSFNVRYICAEIGRGKLKAYKRGKVWLISQRAFREWWENPERGSRRGNRSAAKKSIP